MHVAPPELRALRQDGLVIRFAVLGSIAFVLVEVPESGSSGMSIEQPSRQPAWALVIDGEVTFEGDGGPFRVPAGHALHIPVGGSEHRLSATGGSRIAGFVPIEPTIDVSEPFLARQGFEILGSAAGGAAPIVVAMARGRAPDPGVIDARTWPMPPYALTTAHFGPASGYTADWCDAPHWGLVTDGQLVIEYEHDVEIVTAGDVYYCPAGAPAHRLEAADPATIIDLTPIEDIVAEGRIAAWRRAAFAQAGEQEHAAVSVVALG